MNNRENFDRRKIRLTIVNKFMSSKDTKETHVIHHKTDNIEIMIDNY